MKGRFPDVRPSVAASGIRFPKLRGDDELIVIFQGQKNIKEFLSDDEKADDAIYLILFDGVNTFNLSLSFKLAQQEWKLGNWYYLHNNGEVETKLNPMIDWEIYDLGANGSTVDCDEYLDKKGKLKLDDGIIGVLNYTKLNNPFRGTKHDPKYEEKKSKKA